jgi:protein-S-isoprenylcysteine O-methyltransferase Ste14
VVIDSDEGDLEKNMILTFNKLIYSIWEIFFGYWALSALRNRSQIERQESLFSRFLYLGLIGLAISLIVFDPLIYGLLLWRILPNRIVVNLIGVVITILGLSFAVWARLHLGRYWSARITLTANHQLISTGPYGLVRHPIYTGGLVGVVGTAVVTGEIRGILALVFVIVAFARKIRLEEAWLLQRFGSAYSQYQKDVKSLIPFLL